MGYTTYDTISVACWNEKGVRALHAEALSLFPEQLVGPLVRWTINGGLSFAVQTCGSKSGWADKAAHEAACHALMDAANRLNATDGAWADAVWLQWGGDMDGCHVLRSTWEQLDTSAPID